MKMRQKEKLSVFILHQNHSLEIFEKMELFQLIKIIGLNYLKKKLRKCYFGIIILIRVIQREQRGILVNIVILDRKSTRLNSSHVSISYAVCCLKKNTRD